VRVASKRRLYVADDDSSGRVLFVEGWTRQPERAELENQLNQAGREGYAIVSFTTTPGDPSNYPKTIVILKRPIR
jgi:hypothetical protein